MKQIVTAVLAIITLSASAQKKRTGTEEENFFRFGAKAGVNINKITGQSYKNGFNYNFQVGAFAQFNITDRFGIQPEVNFVQSSSDFGKEASDVYDDIFRDGTQKEAKLDRLEIPLLLNINVGESKHVKFQVGPAYTGLLSEKVNIDTLKSQGFYKKAEWAAIGGVWIQLPLINFGARYKLGLTNINNIDDKDKWRSQAIQVFVGVTF